MLYGRREIKTGLKLITPPAEPAVSLTEAKRHVHAEDFADDDAYLEALVAVATSWIDGKDGWLSRAIGGQTWEYALDDFPRDCWSLDRRRSAIRVPLAPLISVESVKYDDSAGDEQTLSTDEYTVDSHGDPGWIVPGANGWPSTECKPNAVRIRFVAGYSAIPAPIKHAILLLVGHLYKNREATTTERPAEMPFTVSALLTPFMNKI